MLPSKRIAFVFGTRPEAIKMVPVILEMKKYHDMFEPMVIVTGQHREMLDQVLSIFGIKPDYDLAIMEKGQTLSGILTKAIQGLEEIFLRERPDMVLVQGDTSTTFAAALAAFYHRIPVGHIEAGLRTGNKYSPFPEEINRTLTGHLATIHFAPTEISVGNLLKEGIDRKQILLSGNTVIDALQKIAVKDFDLASLGLEIAANKKMILVTTHRRENWGMPLKNTCQAIKTIAEKYADQVQFVIPVHKNPIVQESVQQILAEVPNVKLIEPVDYEPFVHLMKRSDIILTDSGGIQEEAPSLGKPVLVLRDTTERPEAVTAKTVKIVGTNPETIIKETELLLTDEKEYQLMSKANNPYGDGKASERIILRLLNLFGFVDKKPDEFKF